MAYVWKQGLGTTVVQYLDEHLVEKILKTDHNLRFLRFLQEIGLTWRHCIMLDLHHTLPVYAAKKGRLHVLHWLQEMGFTAKDMRVSLPDVLIEAARTRNMSILRWLKREMKINLADMKWATHVVLARAVYSGHMEILHWLEKMGLTAEDCRKRGSEPIRLAVRAGNPEVMAWLQKKGISRGDLLESDYFVLKTSFYYGSQKEAFVWMQSLGVTKEDCLAACRGMMWHHAKNKEETLSWLASMGVTGVGLY